MAGELVELNSRLGAILTPALLISAMGASGKELLNLSPSIGAKTTAGAKAGMGAKTTLSAKAVLGSQLRIWRLHPLSAAATATAGLAAAGGMVFAVGVSPMSPFHTQTEPATERQATAANVTNGAVGSTRSAGTDQAWCRCAKPAYAAPRSPPQRRNAG